MTEDGGNTIENLIDMASDIKDIYDENKETIDGLVNMSGSDNSVVSMKRLADASKDDDKVVMQAEVPKAEDVKDLRFRFQPDEMNLVIGSEEGSVTFTDIPEDCNVQELTAEINNGILSVTIPRGDENGSD